MLYNEAVAYAPHVDISSAGEVPTVSEGQDHLLALALANRSAGGVVQSHALAFVKTSLFLNIRLSPI